MTTKKTTRTRADAKKLMWKYYSENKANLPKRIRECREEILAGLCVGDDVSCIFESLSKIVEHNTAPCPQ